MGIFDIIFDKASNKKLSFDNPVFIKEFERKNDTIKVLEGLLKEPEKYDVKKVQTDLKLFNEGMIGEEKVSFELKNSHMPILIIHNLDCKFNNLNAQIDYIIISQSYIIAVECKNMIGDLEITNSGEFIRHYKNSYGKYYKKECMYSPITQNERHAYLLKDILNHMNVVDKSVIDNIVLSKIVLTNPKTYINKRFAPKQIKDKVIRADQIIDVMHKLSDEYKPVLSEDDMKCIANKLLVYQNFDEKNINIEKYKLNVNNKEPKEKNIKAEEIVVNNKKDTEEIEKSPLYNELKSYRYNKSKEEKIKPYMIFYNNTLEQIVTDKPTNKDDLMKIKGISTVKCDKYGQDIIKIVAKYV